MAADIRVTFPYVPAEHAEAVSGSGFGGRALRFIRFCALGMATVLTLATLIVILFAKAPIATVLSGMWPLVPLIAFWYWGAPAAIQVLQTRQSRREGIQEGRDVETVLLGKDGVTPGSRWSQPIPWSEVRRVRETKNLIIIDATADSPTYLPKHVMNADDRARLKELLREQFRDRPRDLLLTSAGMKIAKVV